MKRLILDNKLKPPSCEQRLARDELVARINADPGAKLTLLTAPAGYGKSTLMALAQKSLDHPSVWYRFDRGDADVAVMITHLVAGVRRHLPDFGDWVNQYLRRAAGGQLDLGGLLMAFANEYQQKVNDQLSFFLDELNTVTEPAATLEALQFFIERLPDDTRFIIASRVRPELSISKMRIDRLLLELQVDELKFDLGETITYLSRDGHSKIGRDAVREIYRNTEGWPAALSLIRNRLERRGALSSLDIRIEAFKDLEEYLVEEVWDDLDGSHREFLMRSSLLDEIDHAASTDVIMDERGPDGADLFHDLIEDEVLTTRIGDGAVFRMHPLMRDFLQERFLAQAGDAEVRRQHQAFADAFERRGEPDCALRHYKRAGRHEDVIRLVERYGLIYINSGQHSTLARWLKGIPPDLVESRPWLCYFKARASEMNDIESWSHNLELACAGFRAAGDRRGLFLSLLSRLELLTLIDNYTDCARLSEEILELADSPEERLLALHKQALVRMFTGDVDLAMQLWDEARGLDDGVAGYSSPLNNAQMSAGFYLGDFRKILEVSEGALDGIDESVSVGDRFVIIFWRALAFFEGARYAEAARLLEEAAELHLGRDYCSRQPALDVLAAQVQLYAGASPVGRKVLKRLAIRIKNSFQLGPEIPFNYVGSFERQRRAPAKALQLHRMSLDLQARKRPYTLASTLVNIGADKIRLSREPSSAGMTELAAAEALGVKLKSEYILTQVHFHRAWRALERGRRQVALAAIARSLAGARRYMHDHFISQEGRISLDLLGLAFSEGIEREYVTRVFELIGPRSLPALAPLLDAGNSELRRDVVAAMARAGGVSALPRLRRLLNDSDPEVVRATREALERIRAEAGSPRKLLSRREYDVLAMIAEGASNPEIGRRLVITEPTVKSHVSSIFRKLGVSTRVQAATYFNQLEDYGADGREG